MNTTRWVSGLVGAALLATAACGDSDGNLYQTTVATQTSAIQTMCACFAALEYASAAACEADLLDLPTPTQASCIEETYATYRAELRPSVDCELAAISDAEACVQEVVMCDRTSLDACRDAADEAIDACPDVPENVQTAVRACFN